MADIVADIVTVGAGLKDEWDKYEELPRCDRRNTGEETDDRP